MLENQLGKMKNVTRVSIGVGNANKDELDVSFIFKNFYFIIKNIYIELL